jgi:hypothetical protein
MDANAWIALAGLGAAGTSAYLSSRQNRQNREAAEEQAELDRDERKGTNLLEVASRESLADPFRQQNAQATSLGMLDRIATAQRGTTSINVPPEMQRFMPTRTGGYSYEASPDLRTAAKLLQRSVASGETAPTMTNPANYGATSARNLNDPGSIGMGARPNTPTAGAPGTGASGAVPRTGAGAPTVAGPAAAPGNTMSNSYFGGGATAGSPSYSTDERDMQMNAASGNPAYANYRRRREGAGGALSGGAKYAQLGASVGSVVPGVGTALGGIVGGIGGLIGGAFTKNAKTAMSDFYLDDAKQILRDQSEALRGRPATEEEIDDAITGQGWKPGNRWVGQEGLDYILQQWALQGEQARGDDEDDEEFAPSYSGLFA